MCRLTLVLELDAVTRTHYRLAGAVATSPRAALSTANSWDLTEGSRLEVVTVLATETGYVIVNVERWVRARRGGECLSCAVKGLRYYIFRTVKRAGRKYAFKPLYTVAIARVK